MNTIELKYFTGTGNSLRILKTCKIEFEKNDFIVDFSPVTDTKDFNYDCGLAGFCFPVYAFGLPRICREFLNNLAVQKSAKKAFLIVTAGDADAVGYALKIGKEALKKKNYNVVYSEVVKMPSNWITFMDPPTKEAAQIIVEKGIKKATQIANDIVQGIKYHHPFNVPERLSRIGLYWEHNSFHKLGIYNLWRMFRTTSNCNSCGVCVKICPTKSIDIKEDTPKWKSSCEQCMRCVNVCKQEAIFQTFGGRTDGKSRYLEPQFSPYII